MTPPSLVDLKQILSLYTHGDAPVNPPLSGALRVCCFMSRDLFVKVVPGEGPDVLTECRITVRLPRRCLGDPQRLRNSQMFRSILGFLRRKGLVVLLTQIAREACTLGVLENVTCRKKGV